MAKRKTRKTKTRKTARKMKRPSRKTTRKKPAKASARMKSVAANKKAHWEAYQHLQKRCDQAWAKLKADVKRKARPEVLVRGKNQLLLLLGECNYMARECTRFSSGRRG